ncbi:MAG: MBL fold metallo-hydrolase [Planctomycetota bacterium]
MERTRIATAVVVTRGSGRDVEVLVVRRSPRLRFFGGYWAFPGGVVDEADHDGDPDDDDAHRRCALRELVEEVGLVPDALAEARALRPDLLARDDRGACRQFRALVEAAPHALDAVHPFARLTTPPFAPVLYRTRFTHVVAPDDFDPDIVPGELVDGEFARPSDVLDVWRHGDRLVAPPVVFFLELLAQGGLETFLESASDAAAALEEGGHLHPVRNVPGIVMAPLATRTLPPATTTNAYVVGEERLYVVDPAPTDTGEQKRLFALLDERCAAGGRVVGVLPTHHHPDHVGAVEATALRYDVPVLAHPETLSRVSLGDARTEPLHDGDVLELGRSPDGGERWTLTALHTPGHAPGHLAFRESRYGAVVAGDLVSTLSTIVIDPPDGHMATYLKSLERVLDLVRDGGVLHPAHGPVATDGARLLQRTLDHRGLREESLVGALERGRATEEALVRTVYADVDERLLPLAARSLRAGLEKLAEEGRAVERAKGRWELAVSS